MDAGFDLRPDADLLQVGLGVNSGGDALRLTKRDFFELGIGESGGGGERCGAVGWHDDDKAVREEILAAVRGDEAGLGKLVHFRFVGGEEEVGRGARLDLHFERVGRGKIKEDLVAAGFFVGHADFLQGVGEAGGGEDLHVISFRMRE